MKKTLFITFLFICGFRSYGQGLVWAEQISGIYEEIPESMKIDSKGNIYIAGTFSGTADMDPGVEVFNITSNGAQDIFIVKLDSAGNFIWAHSIGAADYDKCHSLIVDKHDNLYLAGEFNLTVDFNPGPGVFNLVQTGYEDAYICKFDKDGNFIWAKQISGTDAVVYASSMDWDHSGHLILTGGFWATVDFDPNAGAYNLTSFPADIDIFVSKFDSLGNLIWTCAMNGTQSEEGISIKADSIDNIYISGYYTGTTDFDPGTGTFSIVSTGSTDSFISKLSSSGNLVWVKTFGSPTNDSGGSLVLDSNANIFYAGSFTGTIDFDPGPGVLNLTSAGESDFINLKLDSTGSLIWAKQIGGLRGDGGYKLIVMPNGESYFKVSFAETVDLDPGPGVFNLTCLVGPTVGNDAILKLDASGEFVWAQQLEDDDQARIFSFALDNHQRLMMAGMFFDTLDINPGPASEELHETTGWGDIFLTVWNTNTCAYMNSATTTAGNEITAVMSNANYQWLDCSTSSVLPGDTIQTYTATSNGSYAVIVSDNVCRDTSTCVTIMTTSTGQVNNSNFTMFPNPTNGTVTISAASSTGPFNARIINLSGQTVAESKNISGTGHQVDLSKEPAGIYFIEILQNDVFERFKLIKN